MDPLCLTATVVSPEKQNPFGYFFVGGAVTGDTGDGVTGTLPESTQSLGIEVVVESATADLVIVPF